MMIGKKWKLSPSDFSFLYECKRCFYLKVVENRRQVTTPMPGIFTKIASLEKNYFDNKRAEQISKLLPPGKVVYGEKWVKSEDIIFDGYENACFISGRFDNVVEFDDGGYAVIDFKTAETKADHVRLYSRQLHAYSYALEKPAMGALSLTPIKKIGLCCLEPTEMRADGEGFALKCEAKWIECERNDASFMEFLKEVVSILSLDEPPKASFDCQWCQYREYSRNSGY